MRILIPKAFYPVARRVFIGNSAVFIHPAYAYVAFGVDRQKSVDENIPVFVPREKSEILHIEPPDLLDLDVSEIVGRVIRDIITRKLEFFVYLF